MEEPNPACVAGQHGVIGLSRKVAGEYAAADIRVNAVCRGWTRTPLIERSLVDPDVEVALVTQSPQGRSGTPEEVAAAVLQRCSNAASFVTGASLVIDGEMLA